MNKIRWFTGTSKGGLSIGFDNASDAETFLHIQSKNPEWLKQWTIEYLDNGVRAICDRVGIFINFP